MRLSVIVPYHRDRASLERCLAAAATAGRHVSVCERIVVADGSTEDLSALGANGTRVLTIPGPRGPAVARNRGAEAASGDLLVFVDADVCLHEDALARFIERFASSPDTAAVFGAYDDRPADQGFVSRAKNLTHSFFHRQANPDAFTFWAGLGAVRRDAFARVGGFDERFTRPSVEDIDLGYRLRAAGYRIRVDPTIQGTHLKRWTLRSSIVSDIRDRGIPWTQLTQRYGGMANDLNVSIGGRLCVTLALLAVLLAAASAWAPLALAGTVACGVGLWALERRLYAFLAERQGRAFAARWFFCRLVHHLGNALAYLLGSVARGTKRTLQIDVPGALPLEAPAAVPRPPRTVRRLAPRHHVVVVGAGPAGLTAAYELATRGIPVTVLEGDRVVGGISRTVQYKGLRFDIGGHRFFTKLPVVERLWEELLSDEFISVPRLSRIHYNGRYFNYPLKPLNALAGLGPVNSALVIASFLRWRLRPYRVEETFEQWVTNRFGRRLFEIFFKTYTEKVWGVPCSEIRAEWAAQRIQNLSLARAILSTVPLNRRPTAVRSLIDQFRYPRLGPGQMWERCRDRVEALGGRVLMQHRVTRLELGGGQVVAAHASTPDGQVRIPADHVISSAPLRSLVRAFGAEAPPAARTAAEGLRYRDFLLVALVLSRDRLFSDNWIYVHTPGVKVGRIQNFNNWSAAMVPTPGTTCLGLEYFCFEGDGLWESPDADLISQARHELEVLGLARGSDVVDAAVVRTRKAYPIYDAAYRGYVDAIRAFIDGIPNLHTVGRNGMHKYNNQDHSMLTAMMAVWNMEGASHDIWEVNTDFEYHETQRLEPRSVPETAVRR